MFHVIIVSGDLLWRFTDEHMCAQNKLGICYSGELLEVCVTWYYYYAEGESIGLVWKE